MRRCFGWRKRGEGQGSGFILAPFVAMFMAPPAPCKSTCQVALSTALQSTKTLSQSRTAGLRLWQTDQEVHEMVRKFCKEFLENWRPTPGMSLIEWRQWQVTTSAQEVSNCSVLSHR